LKSFATFVFKGDDWRGTEKGDRLERDFAAFMTLLPPGVKENTTLMRLALVRSRNTNRCPENGSCRSTSGGLCLFTKAKLNDVEPFAASLGRARVRSRQELEV
jgi:hypothetical protein